MQKKREFILHLGLHKTATTTAQTHLLPSNPGYLGKNADGRCLAKENGLVKELRYLATSHRFLHPMEVHDRTQKLGRKIDLLAGSLDESIPITVSDEDMILWQTFTNPLHAYPVGPGGKKRNRRHRPVPIAEFLRKYFDPAIADLASTKVVITLRNQADYLASLYAQYSKLRRNAGQTDFERQVHNLIASQDPSIDWDGVITDLEWAVGPDNITVLFFEDIADQDFFWERLGKAMGLSEFCSVAKGSKSTPRENGKSVNFADAWTLSNRRPVSYSVSSLCSGFGHKGYGKKLLSDICKKAIDPAEKIAS